MQTPLRPYATPRRLGSASGLRSTCTDGPPPPHATRCRCIVHPHAVPKNLGGKLHFFAVAAPGRRESPGRSLGLASAANRHRSKTRFPAGSRRRHRSKTRFHAARRVFHSASMPRRLVHSQHWANHILGFRFNHETKKPGFLPGLRDKPHLRFLASQNLSCQINCAPFGGRRELTTPILNWPRSGSTHGKRLKRSLLFHARNTNTRSRITNAAGGGWGGINPVLQGCVRLPNVQ